jgi:hypothetical protein
MKVDHLTFKAVWIKGTNNKEADALSRNPCSKAEPEDELDEVFNATEILMITLIMNETSATNVS